MSRRCTVSLWAWGPFYIHRYVHSAQFWHGGTRVYFWDLGIGRRDVQLWPWNMTYLNNPWLDKR